MNKQRYKQQAGLRYKKLSFPGTRPKTQLNKLNIVQNQGHASVGTPNRRPGVQDAGSPRKRDGCMSEGESYCTTLCHRSSALDARLLVRGASERGEKTAY